MKEGARVGAIQKADASTVYLFGYGTYAGDKADNPLSADMGMAIPNPKIELDGGGVVWGFECWWGSEAKVRESIGDRAVVIVQPLTRLSLQMTGEANGK